ncbi:hypothetical protein [Prosthecobacter vanneervenii]|uniref:Uncharacterized protein n=1 Tax=Prosthecobacter vanneervenii TaxID=48466 RepID=A0A7W7YE23_9BACT|nr:hypothetical protein [Prosthecobacter vanneervenii]MBB5034477.1 hypothetical protein [Prosthecobacter vanneervenii]
MPAAPYRTRHPLTICAAVVGLCLGWQVLASRALASGDDPAPPEAATPAAPAEQTPADFLDHLGQRVKARWRLQFRPPPPTPPADRGRAALILGSLMADSFLVWQASDSQQFRNNNQEVLSYCRMLGLGEKLSPRLMAQGKMAESNEWKELRSEIVDDHQEMLRLLREQRDDDLAVMIDLGLWLRLLEISTNLVVENAAEEVRPLCIGSPAVLQSIRDDFNRISLPRHDETMIKQIGAHLEAISTLWRVPQPATPTQEQVSQTQEKLHAIMHAMVEKPQQP